MDIQHVPPALQEQLGPDATLSFLSAVNTAGRQWKDDVMNAATDRFERRLVEVAAGLQQQMAQMESRLQAKMSDLLKWSFVFWIGQVIAMTAIMSALLRVS